MTVKTTARTLRATIRSIDATEFTVTHGRTSTLAIIQYSDVIQLKPAGLRRSAKIAILAGALYGAIFIIGPIGGAVGGH